MNPTETKLREAISRAFDKPQWHRLFGGLLGLPRDLATDIVFELREFAWPIQPAPATRLCLAWDDGEHAWEEIGQYSKVCACGTIASRTPRKPRAAPTNDTKPKETP